MGKPRMTQKDQHKPAHKRYWAYKDELRRLVGIPTWRFPPPIRLHIVAYIALPPSLSKKEIAERAGHWHRIVPDASNILKGVEDILFVKDEKIADVACKKYWESTGPFLSLLPSLELEVVW